MVCDVIWFRNSRFAINAYGSKSSCVTPCCLSLLCYSTYWVAEGKETVIFSGRIEFYRAAYANIPKLWRQARRTVFHSYRDVCFVVLYTRANAEVTEFCLQHCYPGYYISLRHDMTRQYGSKTVHTKVYTPLSLPHLCHHLKNSSLVLLLSFYKLCLAYFLH